MTVNASYNFDELNPAQREAAQWGAGPVLVLAGPGSGKTKVLTYRIARLLDTSRGETFRILGLTFTNKAADEMRSRVAKLVPGQESRLFLGTFHSFCGDVLRQHGTHLGIHPNFEIYSQNADLEAVLCEAVEKAKAESSVVSDLDKKTLPVIHWLKSHLVLPNDCRKAFNVRDAALAERMAVVYPRYEAELLERNILDFPSMILRAFELFNRFPAFAKRYRTVYPYVCVDEFQDTNDAQYQLLRSILGSGTPNVFVVADDDQIIYQWNGASHQRLEQLTSDLNPHLIQLPMNYRCPAEIVALANSLIQHNLFRTSGKKPLESFQGNKGGETVRVLFDCPDSEEEANGIAQDIKRLHSEHLGTVVGIARSRKLLLSLEGALRQVGVSACIAQRKDEFESPPLVWVHSMLRLANERHSERYCRAVCGSFGQLAGLKIDENDVISRANASHHDFLRQWIEHGLATTSDESIKLFLSGSARKLADRGDFLGFCQDAIRWCQSLTSSGADQQKADVSLFDEERDVWNGLLREIGNTLGDEMSLEAFLQELQMRSKEPEAGPGVVSLYTIHASKGKEFDHVYLIGLAEDELPSFQSKKKGDRSPEMEEERRNCFVAITRASKTLTLSYAKKYNGWPKEPSRFVYEMGLLQRPEKKK